MAEDRPTRLSAQLVRRIKRDTAFGFDFVLDAEAKATISRLRWKDDEQDYAWELKVPCKDGTSKEFRSKIPASELVTYRLEGKYSQDSGWHQLYQRQKS